MRALLEKATANYLSCLAVWFVWALHVRSEGEERGGKHSNLQCEVQGKLIYDYDSFESAKKRIWNYFKSYDHKDIIKHSNIILDLRFKYSTIFDQNAQNIFQLF